MNGLDRLFSGLRAASSGLSAERLRIDVIADNIANSQTTRTDSGGPFRRRVAQFEPILLQIEGNRASGGGVRVTGVLEDFKSPMERIQDPGHPDADAEGMVELPNVNTIREMADLMTSMRAYEANLSVQQNFIRMAERALQLAS